MHHTPPGMGREKAEVQNVANNGTGKIRRWIGRDLAGRAKGEGCQSRGFTSMHEPLSPLLRLPFSLFVLSNFSVGASPVKPFKPGIEQGKDSRNDQRSPPLNPATRLPRPQRQISRLPGQARIRGSLARSTFLELRVLGRDRKARLFFTTERVFTARSLA